jgi:DNA polymerase III epsilon subunit-like protein
MQGFAVIDLETAGLAYHHTDRLCEIGVVLVEANSRAV